MRTQEDVIKSIIKFIILDENIKYAILNGSRANPNAPQDFMQDYDIAFYVDNLEEAKNYKNNQSWIVKFGKVVIVQQNDFDNNAFIIMIQYFDGLRLDLSFHDIKSIDKNLQEDSLSVVIFDRYNTTMNVPKSSERSYITQKPTECKWNKSLNDIWWLQAYIAKELWRDEIPLAKELYDVWMFNYLRDLLSWHISIDRNWTVNVGHGGKWFKRLLSPEIYEQYIYFYSNANKDEQWKKLLDIGEFIRKIAVPLSDKLGYKYPYDYDENVSNYIRMIYKLPPNAVTL